jgi:predicted nucleic acid-binding protein
MDSIFFDTDVCVDMLAQRSPFFEMADKLILHTEKNGIKRVISESCIPNLIYVLTESYKISDSNERLMNWIIGSSVISMGKEIILQALNSPFKDKEDAIQYYTALNYGVDYFITQNKRDFAKYTTILPVYTPTEFLENIQ